MAAQSKHVTRRPKSWNRRVQTLRHLIQAGFAAFIVFAVVRFALTPEGNVASAPSPEAYSPFGGFETLFRYVQTGGQFVSHTHSSNLVLFGAVVLSALIARSFFCGWVCPFGALQEALAFLSKQVQRRVPGLRRRTQTLGQHIAVLSILDRWLRYLKYLVLGWILAGTAFYGFLVFRNVDPWAALITITQIEVSGGLVVLGLIVVASLFVERPWCRYACPLGLVIGLVGKVSPIKIERESSACLACDVCTKNCPMGIPVHTLTRVSSVECIMCLECVGSCPSRGGLDLKLVLPGMVNKPGVEQPLSPTRPRLPTPVPTSRRWKSTSVNALAYAALGLVLFLGTIQIGQLTGIWATSGRPTATGQAVVVTGADPDEIKGWMTIQQVSDAYGVSIAEFDQKFDIPPSTPPTTALKDLEKVAPNFSVTEVRTWLSER